MENMEIAQVDERVYVLSRPIQFDGEQHTELLLDFDALTGEDLLACERQLNVIVTKTREVIAFKELSKSYLALVAAKAAKVPVELLYKLNAKDFSKVTVRVQNFLLN